MVTRGFIGRPRPADGALPPGQYVTDDFPVLTAGPTPLIPEDAWALAVTDGVTEATYSWASLHGLGAEDIMVDIHCVTHWSKLGTSWRGIPVERLLADAGVTDEPYALVSSYGDYTTSLTTEDITHGDAIVATAYDGGPIPPEHGGPVRLLVPHLYLWKSAKWLREIRVLPEEGRGFWENAGYHDHADPWLEERYHGD